MQLKYVGPSPSISHSSVTFSKYKEDKFVYINVALQILKALDHNYDNGMPYTYLINTPTMSTSDLEKMIVSFYPTIDEYIKHHHDKLFALFNEEIGRVQNSNTLDMRSKEVFINNHTLMKEYRLQRDTNKSVYYILIEKINNIIIKNNIQYITAPLNERFDFVLITIQNTLLHRKVPTFTELRVIKEKGELKTKLLVTN